MIRRSLLMTHPRHYCTMVMFIMLRKKMLAALIVIVADIGAPIDNNAYLEVEMCVLYLGLFRNLAHVHIQQSCFKLRDSELLL